MRQTMGVAGEWQFVQNYTSVSSAPTRSEVPSVSEGANGGTVESSDGDRKREAPVDDIDDERVFKLRKKTVDIGLGDLYDPGLIPIKLKVKKEESTEPQPVSSKIAVDDIIADAQDVLPTDAKVKIAWKRAAFQPAVEEPAPDGVKADSGGEGDPKVKLEEPGAAKEGVLHAKIKPESQTLPEPAKKEEVISPSLEAHAPTSLFRKRKLPTRR
jgi:WW domain-binding protein 4